jgi:DNA topoisomerase-3
VSTGYAQPRRGDDKGDHPPITPMRANDGQLSGDALRIYNYVCAHFVATLMTPCKYAVTTVRAELAGEQFATTGRIITDPGFTRAMPWLAGASVAVAEEGDDDDEFNDDQKMPLLRTDQLLDIANVKLLERQTVAPSHLTESELITLMERHGVGTDASIPQHINNIQTRNYVQVAPTGRRLLPTALGVQLVHAYWTVDADLVLPTMRAQVEQQLSLIAEGRADYIHVKQHTLDVFRAKFVYFVQNMASVDLLFETSFTSLAASGRPFARCGKCRRYMRLIEARPQRLHCNECHDTYALPSHRDAQFQVSHEHACAHCAA